MSEVDSYTNDRVIKNGNTNAVDGNICWSPEKSIWFTAMALGWLIGGAYYFSWGAVGAFILLSGITLCFGHSLGMHRKLIHDSYDCPVWMERLGVWLGTLVGLGGPFTMMRTHDMRDWAQRQSTCHPFFSHQSGMLKDAWWQIHCKLHLAAVPAFKYPQKLTGSRFYRFIQATSMLQQLVLVGPLFLIGG